MNRTQLAAIAVLTIIVTGILSLGGSGTANADPPDGKGPETRELRASLRKADAPVVFADENGLPPKALGDENRVPRIGDFKYWLALNDHEGRFYFKQFQLRAMSDGAEAWVVPSLNFPVGDCRNDGVRTTISDAQLGYLLSEFDTNIRPTDVDWFGEPDFHNGKQAQLRNFVPGAAFGKGSNTYYNKAGRDVILIDNVRDDNYYDINNASNLSYIAGFFTTAMEFYHDRNVITIDGYDWLHRTGANPPHQPTNNLCTSAPARPFLYEGVFAHEYQHLIHADYDPDETNWVNEGMSDFAEILTGYVDPSLHVDEKGFDSHTNAFLGWLSVAHPNWNPIPRASGPENSLTVWGDQGDGEILEDYGFAFYFMTYLESQGYDQAFFTAWHHNPLNGIDGLNDTLGDVGATDTFASLFTDIAVSALADGYLDTGGAGIVTGPAAAADIQNSNADATIYFSGNANDTTGAPPWGSDYIQLGSGASLTSVSFNGASQFFFPAGPQWSVDSNGYYAVAPQTAAPGPEQYASNLDVSITHPITVTGAGMLTFNHFYDTELDWDFGFVQVSGNGGQTWTSIGCSGTTSQHDPGAIAPIVANLPGYSGTAGSAGTPIAASCDLSTYIGAGPVILAFRFMSDPSVEQTGWFVKDVKLDGVTVGTAGSLAGWDNQKSYDPVGLGFIIQFVGLTGAVDAYGDVTAATSVVVVRPTLDGDNDATLTATELAALSASGQVIAIISGVPEVEDNGIYGPYSLLVNGTERSDGQ